MQEINPISPMIPLIILDLMSIIELGSIKNDKYATLSDCLSGDSMKITGI
jgi:hypothetical protein